MEMENQQENPAGFETEEDFSDEFQCCVCLDLLYKPVVLACGHISCFWCVFKAMDLQVSHCPVCRHQYIHFPGICQLLHFLLLKLYPTAYKRREQQVIEEEKRSEQFSPQLDNCFTSEPIKKLYTPSGVPPHSATSSCDSVEGELSATNGSESTIVPHKEEKMSIPIEPNFEATEKVAPEQDSIVRDKLNKQQSNKQLLVTDFLCVVCMELLCRPVVLNCGHVYCAVCIINLNDVVPRCQVCQSAHPNGYPKVCLVLEHFLEEQFCDQYALRKQAVYKQANNHNGDPSALPGSTQSRKDAAKLPSISPNAYRSCLSGQGPKVHLGVGCDYCGMCPIIGERYRCKDCREKIGFDLCEGCYNSSSKLLGRFNQQHTPEHKLENVQPMQLVSLFEADGYDSPDDMGDTTSAYSGFAHVSEDSSGSPTASDALEDQEGTHSTI